MSRLALVGAPAGLKRQVPLQLLLLGLPLIGQRLGSHVFSNATRDGSRKFWDQILVKHPEKVRVGSGDTSIPFSSPKWWTSANPSSSRAASPAVRIALRSASIRWAKSAGAPREAAKDPGSSRRHRALLFVVGACIHTWWIPGLDEKHLTILHRLRPYEIRSHVGTLFVVDPL